jgi:hypothetical protein
MRPGAKLFLAASSPLVPDHQIGVLHASDELIFSFREVQSFGGGKRRLGGVVTTRRFFGDIDNG